MRLHARGVRVLGVDFNPQAVRRCRDLGIEAEYGDATDPEFLAGLPLAGARWLVSTSPVHVTGLSYEDMRETLLQTTREIGFRGRIAVTSHSEPETRELEASGADVVLEPYQDAADRAVDILCGGEQFERTTLPEDDTRERPLG